MDDDDFDLFSPLGELERVQEESRRAKAKEIFSAIQQKDTSCRRQYFERIRRNKKKETRSGEEQDESDEPKYFEFQVDKRDFEELGILLEKELNGAVLEKSRHSSFSTTDYSFKPDSDVYRKCKNLVLERFVPLKWPFFSSGSLEFLDLFLVVYDAADGQKGLDFHTDGCLFSFNILLSSPLDFDGGGTALQLVEDDKEPPLLFHLQQGQGLVHDAKILHAGKEITRGVRKLLVGFVETRQEALVKWNLIGASNAKRNRK